MKKILLIALAVVISLAACGELLGSEDSNINIGEAEPSITVKVEENSPKVSGTPVTESPSPVPSRELPSESPAEMPTPETSPSAGEDSERTFPNTDKGPSVTVPDEEETEGDLVWVPTNGGTKYHSKSSCSKMEDPMQVSRETAEANGYTPCGRCW